MFKKVSLYLIFTIVLLKIIGCTKEVPIGYTGMVQERGGLTGVSLAPGRHLAWHLSGGVKMVLVEASEKIYTEKMNILCKDKLNFSFDLKIRSQIKNTDGKSLKKLLDNKGSEAQLYKGKNDVIVLNYNALYKTYVQPSARSLSRGIVSKYETTEIAQNRDVIDKAISTALVNDMKGTPIIITLVASSNYDYPKVITSAMEKKKQREIAVEQEKANQALKLLQASNRQKLAQKMIVVRAAEGQAEAAYLKQISPNLSRNYVELRKIEAKIPMWKNVGPGDKVIVSGNGAIPIVGK